MTIHSYSFKKDQDELNFYKTEKDNPLYLGLELEVEPDDGVDREDVVYAVRELGIDEDLVIFKHDGSLDYGVELVFDPMTKRYITKELDIRKLLATLSEYTTSWNNERCGIHIHIGREYFDEHKLKKLITFFHKCKKQIKKLSGRTDSQIRQWCKFPRYPVITDSDLNDYYDTSRYMAVNVQPEGTIELRIFRGTLYAGRFLAYIRFTTELLSFLDQYSLSYLALHTGNQIWKEFMKFVEKRNPHLYRFLIEKGIK